MTYSVILLSISSVSRVLFPSESLTYKLITPEPVHTEHGCPFSVAARNFKSFKMGLRRALGVTCIFAVMLQCCRGKTFICNKNDNYKMYYIKFKYTKKIITKNFNYQKRLSVIYIEWIICQLEI